MEGFRKALDEGGSLNFNRPATIIAEEIGEGDPPATSGILL